jgi:hypothetical protein
VPSRESREGIASYEAEGVKKCGQYGEENRADMQCCEPLSGKHNPPVNQAYNLQLTTIVAQKVSGTNVQISFLAK